MTPTAHPAHPARTAHGPATSRTATTAPAPHSRQVPALWLALLATPVAASANSPVLILPDMASSLGITTASATWLVTAFAWAMATGTPLMAALLRHRGLRTTLHLNAGLVLLGTLIVAFAPSLPLAMAGRVAQAAGGAGLVTAAMSLAGSVRRMGVITAGFGVLGAVGPLLGSLIADSVSWRASMAVSALSVLAVPAVLRLAQSARTAPASGPAFDGRGAALLILTATSVVLIPRFPLPAVLATLVTAALLTLHVRRRPTGFVPAKLLRDRRFVLSTLLACAVATSYFTLLFTVPQLLRDRTDWSTSTIGTGQLVALLAGSVLSMAFAAVSARLGYGKVLTILLVTAALAPLTALFTPWAVLLLPVATLAVFATTAGQATLGVHAIRAADDTERPTAIGLFNLFYQLGGAFGPAIAALLTLGA
ncbi:MFS transporter [Streptomyces purpureus]|uniref:MFS transporter n=1 Tax=Streptomyces purpureus TaxID=1951 RepID=UPI00378A9373